MEASPAIRPASTAPLPFFAATFDTRFQQAGSGQHFGGANLVDLDN
jgi:hypothetical protein